ncbi:MAG TPA: hypothetical protein VGF30_09445 [Bacteroidia bacterium]
MKTFRLPALIIIFLFLGMMAARTALAKTEPALFKVFANESDSLNKLVLKLYDDQTYEFILFTKVKKKTSSKRETGEYRIKGQKLSLESKSKKPAFDHPEIYFLADGIGLFENKKLHGGAVLSESGDKKFSEAFYIDPVFGHVSNDKKLANKLFTPKPAAKPHETKAPEPVIETIKEEAFEGKIAKLSIDSLKKIVAVIVVGPVEESTKGFIEEKKELAKFLKSYGIQVKEFYHPKATWKEIQEGSKDAHIFIYSGHGSTVGENGCSGGLCLSDGTISSTEMLAGLSLHKNALILFNHVCRGAGSSASDDGDIGKVEAAKRVSDYSWPFIKEGAACYYANNTNGSMQPFLERFFNKMPVAAIYKEVSAGETIVVKQKYSFDPRYVISVGADDDSNAIITRTTYTNGVKSVEQIKGSISYDCSYVGIPSFTVVKFFEK